MTALELLAPAKDLATGIVAIDSGADAVYIGAEHHGARAAAGNSVEDIASLCKYAHRFRAKVYVTLNTLIYNDELDSVKQLVRELYTAGVDALIVQDMALLEMDIPPIELHASTQCDTRTPEKARFLQDVGFEQIVLPRELSLEEIREVRRATTVALEGFVHGALCVCYSGDCRASLVNGGRSANRGECAQVCRLPFDLVDGDGKTVIKGRHLLSLKDMNRMSKLYELADAGISSFKIEGRLKSPEYVRNVTAAYSDALDNIVACSNGCYHRASVGRVQRNFRPDVTKSFNRGFTGYFLTDTQPGKGSLASMLTPKHIGEPVGTVEKATPLYLIIDGTKQIVNGDGLGFFSRNGQFIGFRANRVEGNRINLLNSLAVTPEKGTVIYRNYDKAFSDNIASARSKRVIDITAILEPTTHGVALTLNDKQRGCRVTVPVTGEFDTARTPQLDARRRILEKTGDTIYTVTEVEDRVDESVFIPASVLADLRRRAVEALDHNAAATYPIRLRKKDIGRDVSFPKTHLDMHDNVANMLSEQFYNRHNATVLQSALEVAPASEREGEVQVMTSRYCLRRELGACLKTPAGNSIKEPLTLVPADGNTRPLRLRFDCAACRMNVFALPSPKSIPS